MGEGRPLTHPSTKLSGLRHRGGFGREGLLLGMQLIPRSWSRISFFFFFVVFLLCLWGNLPAFPLRAIKNQKDDRDGKEKAASTEEAATDRTGAERIYCLDIPSPRSKKDQPIVCDDQRRTPKAAFHVRSS